MIELERFSETARRSLTLANYEARFVVTGAIEPGHLLFGVVQEATDLADRLSQGRLTPEGIRQRLKKEYASRLQPEPWEGEEMKLSPQAQAVLGEAQRQAEERGHRVVDLPHLLLALLRSKESLPARLLAEAGITRHAIEALMKGEAPGSASAKILER